MNNGVPVGFTIYFKYAVSVRATYDVECRNCGDTTDLSQLSFVVTKIVNIPKSFSGFEALQYGGNGTIPGVDVAAIAAEILTDFKASEEAADIVEIIVSTLSTVGNAVTCQFSNYRGRASLNPTILPHKTFKRAVSAGDVAFSNDDVRVSTKKPAAIPEFFPLVDKLTEAFYILDFYNDTGSFVTPLDFCPFKSEWLKIDSVRCLCSDEHVSENTCKSIADRTVGNDDYATAICHPIVCSPVSDPDPVLRFYSDQPFSDFDDGVAVNFQQKVFEVLHAHANVTDVTVITIGPWVTDSAHTYIDVQYRVAGDGDDPSTKTIIDPTAIDGLPPGETVDEATAPSTANGTVDKLQDPNARTVLRNAIPADFMVSDIKIYATARDASKDDPSFIGQFKVVNGRLSGGFIALIVICILVFLLILAFVGVMIRRRVDPVLTRDSITFIDDVDANPYMYYDNK